MDLLLVLLPAIVMIILVIVTRKVLLSLGTGIILASLIETNWNIIDAVLAIYHRFIKIIISPDYLPILGFVIIIGGITSLISLIGGIGAFAVWAIGKVKTPVAAQLVAWGLGLIICIDDYFNALVIGEVSKPITDQYNVSRAKLSYIIDTTSAPVVILMPFSTWAAYIIGLISSIIVQYNYTNYNGFSIFVSSIPYQFYAILSLIFIFFVVKYNIHLGPMKKFEASAAAGHDESRLDNDEHFQEGSSEVTGNKWALILPILVLVITTGITMLLAAKFNFSLLMEQSIIFPLFYGGIAAFITALIFGFINKEVKIKDIVVVSAKGMLEMVQSAVVILIFAWIISGAIQDLGTGQLLATYLTKANFPLFILPVSLFIISGAMAFATGTSWGSFGIMLPIAIPIAIETDPLMLPMIVGAVLGGAVFGDHCSPVSDTTVLSATGARSTLHAHFVSQLPYALSMAGIAMVGYFVLGITKILILAYLVMFIIMFIIVNQFRKRETKASS